MPTTRTLAEGLRVMGDYAGGLLLTDEEINRERGIILSEKRVSDSVGYRTFVAQFEAMLGTTLLPKRLPIGLVGSHHQSATRTLPRFLEHLVSPGKNGRRGGG